MSDRLKKVLAIALADPEATKELIALLEELEARIQTLETP